MPATRPATPAATHAVRDGRGSVSSVATTISVIASVPKIDSGSRGTLMSSTVGRTRDVRHRRLGGSTLHPWVEAQVRPARR